MRTPKPEAQRQGRGKNQVGLLPGDVVPNPPGPPSGLLPETRARWVEFWASPVAWTIRQDVDLDQLERLFLLRDTYARWRRTTRRTPTVTGSTGQEVAHPLLRAMPAIATEIRQLEDRLGFGGASRLSLGIHLPDPQRTHAGDLEEEDDHGAPAGDYAVPNDPRVLAMRGR